MTRPFRYALLTTCLSLLWACNSNNRNPEILSFNGVEPNTLFGFDFFAEPFFFSPGETVELDVEAQDPDGDPVQVWFSLQPPGLAFDPDATSGVWEVPEDFEEESIELHLIVSDDFDPRGVADILIPYLNADGWYGAWGKNKN